MKTRIPAAFAAGALALSLTACGGDAPEEEPVDEAAEETEDSGVSVLDLVAELGENTRNVDNYTLDIDMVGTMPDLGEVEAAITYEAMDDPEAAKTTMVMPALGEQFLELLQLGGEDPGLTAEELGTSVAIVPSGDEAILSNHNGLQDVDTAWARGVDTDAVLSEETFGPDALARIAETLAEVEQLEEVGAEEISGVGTTLVEGTMTRDEVEALSPEQRRTLDEVLDEVEGAIDMSVWITEDGFPMRMDLSDEDSDVSMVYSKLGETSFEMPSEDEITDL